MRRKALYAIAVGATVLIAATLVGRQAWRRPWVAIARAGDGDMPALARAIVTQGQDQPSQLPDVPVAGLDLTRITSNDGCLTAPAEQGVARLTLDPDLQRTALAIMAARHLPEAAIVLMDVDSGHLLVYASHIEGMPARDLCAEATAPSASVFKIVTAAALVEDAHLSPEMKQCYSGGEQRIAPADLAPDPRRDKWCGTLAGAMGRSVNAVFARLANEHLSGEQLEAMARRFGYGESPSFDVPVQPSALNVPKDPLEFARTAAGFWNTTLSPLEAAKISAIVARGGESVRPSIVDKIVTASGAVAWSAPAASPSRRAIALDTADKLASMMQHTVSEGTSFRAFHDAHGLTFLPGIAVAGKTGTLTDGAAHRYYTWFTGFAPAKGTPEVRRVALAVLVVNGPTWQVKANVLARDMLRAYFASRDVRGVTRPSVSAVTQHRRRGQLNKG
jgi:cell division protein FtsI/penicillin-binding protein 2